MHNHENKEYFGKLAKNKYFDEHHQSNLEDQFLSIPFAVLDNCDFRKDFMSKKRFATYLWLRRKVIRGNIHYLAHARLVFNEYFAQSKLATSIPLTKLAMELGMNKSTVSGHITQLENDGVIQIDWHEDEFRGRIKKYQIFILGRIENNKEIWFLDELYSTQRRNN